MNKLSIYFVFLFIFNSSFSHAAYKPFEKAAAKTESKQKSGWSLDEWLAQRDKNRMMDLWLAMNTSEPFEFYLQMNPKSYTRTTASGESDFTSSAISYSAYASIVGLNVEYENNLKENFNELAGSFRLRLFGNADQASNLTLGFGQLTHQQVQGDYRLLFQEALLSIYLMKYFGLSGTYRAYNKANTDHLGETSGTLSKYGIFIDFKMLRVFGNVYSENLLTYPADEESKVQRSGIESGLRFYF